MTEGRVKSQSLSSVALYLTQHRSMSVDSNNLCCSEAILDCLKLSIPVSSNPFPCAMSAPAATLHSAKTRNQSTSRALIGVVQTCAVCNGGVVVIALSERYGASHTSIVVHEGRLSDMRGGSLLQSEEFGRKLAHQFPWSQAAGVAVGLALRRRYQSHSGLASTAAHRKQIIKVLILPLEHLQHRICTHKHE